MPSNSDGDSGGRIEGSRAASIDLPAPAAGRGNLERALGALAVRTFARTMTEGDVPPGKVTPEAE